MKKRKSGKSAYAQAGVDIDQMMTGLAAVKRMVKRTAVKGVVGDMGSFGGLFAAPGKDHVLVASTDGVGTKLKVAVMADRHDTVGRDLVNHCVNDILVQGARPLFFLDYLGTARLQGRVFREVVSGLCRACRANGCALLGGETAEMPGLYPEGEYDLVGTIVGCVERRRLITGRAIRPGDVVIGLASNGLHTNGYSLARKVVFDKAGLGLNDLLPGTRQRVVDVLLAGHKSYLKPVAHLMAKVRIKGMAHITGGGLPDNLPRILPDNALAVVDRGAWKPPPVFRFIQAAGSVDAEEMYRVFNMGLGLVLVVGRGNAETAMRELRRVKARASVVGRIEAGRKGVVLTG
jgi:phosphoribosylformylglycinamidine cyclo-ligase